MKFNLSTFILQIVLLMSLQELCLTLVTKQLLLFFLTVLLKGYFPPLNCFCTFVKNQLVITALVCCWVLYSSIELRVYAFASKTTLITAGIQKTLVSHRVSSPCYILIFQNCFILLPLHFSMNFRLSLSITTKSLIGILTGIMLN